MNNLIPVKRYDRNGKLVTRNVKPIGSASSGVDMPAPRISISGSNPALAEGWRLTPSQTRQKQRTETGHPISYGTEPVFSASDVEIYGLLAVTSPKNALELLAAGVTGMEEAVEYLSAADRASELTGDIAMSREMLARRVPAEFYLMSIDRLSEEQIENATPELLADYSEFFSIRSIMRKDSPKIADEVLKGEIKLAHVREVGIDNLKTGNRLEIARPAFKEMAKGSEKFTAQDLTAVLQKRVFGDDLSTEVGYLMQYGGESLSRLKGLGVDGFGGMTISEMASKLISDDVSQEDALAVIDYTAHLVEASGLEVSTRSKDKVVEVLQQGKYLRDSGVDVVYAAERIRKYDVQMIAATFNGIHLAVSDGWL